MDDYARRPFRLRFGEPGGQPFDDIAAVDMRRHVLASPCDAIVGACGRVERGIIYQAKGFPYRLEDLLNVTGTAFLGLSLKCARCHDHKFDPIPQADYYKVANAFWAGPIEARGRELLGGPSKDELGFDVLGWTDIQ